MREISKSDLSKWESKVVMKWQIFSAVSNFWKVKSKLFKISSININLSAENRSKIFTHISEEIKDDPITLNKIKSKI